MKDLTSKGRMDPKSGASHNFSLGGLTGGRERERNKLKRTLASLGHTQGIKEEKGKKRKNEKSK